MNNGEAARPLQRYSIIKEVKETEKAEQVRKATQGKEWFKEGRKRCARMRIIA